MNALLLTTLLLAASPSPAPEATPTEAPVEIFAELDGSWEGTFAGYDTTGKELYRIQVRQVYRTLDATTQTVDVADTMADGTVITGKGKNTAHRRDDGTLELRCIVVKSNGEKVIHEGTLGKTPDGLPQLVWHSAKEGRWEIFREVVRETEDGPVYTIDGVGEYGDSVVVMAGRYRRVGDVPTP